MIKKVLLSLIIISLIPLSAFSGNSESFKVTITIPKIVGFNDQTDSSKEDEEWLVEEVYVAKSGLTENIVEIKEELRGEEKVIVKTIVAR